MTLANIIRNQETSEAQHEFYKASEDLLEIALEEYQISFS